MDTITTSRDSGLRSGDAIRFTTYRPWWKRLWLWLTRQRPDDRTFVVSDVTATTMTIVPAQVREKKS